jgi:hypothetical protein
MQQTDFQSFKALMNGMAKLYERELDGPVLDAYWLALRNWELADFQAASGQLMRTSKFMPRPADFEELRRAARPTAGEAWALARASWRAGEGTSGDDLIDRVVQMLGGFGAIGHMQSDQMPFLERRFAEHYAALQEAEEIRAAVPQIASPTTLRIGGPRSADDLLRKLPPDAFEVARRRSDPRQ